MIPIPTLTCSVVLTLALTAPELLMANENRIDRVRPDAPELAVHGAYPTGVRTIDLVNPDQIDLVRTEAEIETLHEPLRSDRRLTLEIWYPATPNSGSTEPYEVFLRDGVTEIELHGRSRRDAQPDRSAAPYPLVIVSHGYPGNRYLLSHLSENLASKGYVVAAIDHTDSTYRTRAAFSSTLLHRPLDQLFVLDQLDALSSLEEGFLAGLADAERTGLIGYSMGGYGALITAGAGLTEDAARKGAPFDTLATHRSSSAAHRERFDERIRAVVALAPWGMERALWNEEGLAELRIPTLFIAGDADDVSGYDSGVRTLWQLATGADRLLLTFENAGHNAAAPMPAPLESLTSRPGAPATFGHYADPVWDTTRMNNIAQHFVTAWFGLLLHEDPSMQAYLDLLPEADQGVWSIDEDGEVGPDHTYWKGFADGTAVGLRLERLAARR